ncbi:hypothetical protein GMORB2_2389 [Geosmithia morbida]|uniref:Uncharacterized protein n=1 Tax=Geosmithia morbida TaxID=1094350 RepID=A0A9P5CYW6_9HYPO|nr:uncharacterized protein GMORB2_2389 [Geosmithia morbida]KAF4120903.1 hypothetical protein GMORB2_2389 [Geosmithia morbida]
MEARSLASLNFLASNPPQYPYNPTEERQQHLTLYISRVPGTRDVILSPFKPQRKNVTVEDVASSLYYVHLDTSSELTLASPGKRQDQYRGSMDGGDSAHRNAIPRKPVPGSAHSDRSFQLQAQSQPQPQLNTPVSPVSPVNPPPRDITQLPSLSSPPGKDNRPALPPRPEGVSSTATGTATEERASRPPPTMATTADSDIGFSDSGAPSASGDSAGGAATEPPVLRVEVPGTGRGLRVPEIPPFTKAPALSPSPVARAQDMAPDGRAELSAVARAPQIARASTITRKAVPSIPRAEEPFTSSRRPYSDISYHQAHLDDLRLDGAHDDHRQGREEALAALSGGGSGSGSQSRERSSSRRPRALSAANSPVWSDSRSPSPRKQQAEPFTLRLIRRDPSSGSQWNVGTVSSAHYKDTDDVNANGNGNGNGNGNSNGNATNLDGNGSSAAHRHDHHRHDGQRHESSPTPRPPLDIVIETSGYAKFRNMPASQPRHLETGFFSRQVTMTYTKSWSSTLRQKLNCIDRNSRHQLPRQPRSGSLNSDGSSSMLTDSTDTTATATTGNTTTTATTTSNPGSGMKARGYVFTSPWDGRCEFRTGNGGRSLTCRHVVHDESTSGAYNPLVAEQQTATTVPPNFPSPIVSELRFNLPSAELFPALSAKDQRVARQKLGNLRKLWKREDIAYDSSDYEEEYDDNVYNDDGGHGNRNGNGHDGHDDDDEISPFDVNLGRERAGGGNSGKRAKLGKLIVTNEGLKMLDLIVAANMGIWWGAWEKSM